MIVTHLADPEESRRATHQERNIPTDDPQEIAYHFPGGMASGGGTIIRLLVVA